jgi:hypothetical protein
MALQLGALLALGDPLLLMAMAPLMLDLTQRVVNVHWTGGLAVEFYDGSGPELPTA